MTCAATGRSGCRVYGDPGDLGRALGEAELVLDVVRRGEVPVGEDHASGAYRLLFRVFASHPDEVRSFFEDTVAPLVRYDESYGSELTATLEAFLEHNGATGAAAAALYVHRHTIAYRLERVKELTGLDPALSEDRERLGLGLKAFRIIAPRLPR
jgi:DNA-binding PucR family transcriptional regulator